MVSSQRGISIIAAVFIITILAFMGVMFVTLVSTSSLTSVNDMQAAQALAVADGGAEYVLENQVFPVYSAAGVSLGSGNFSVTSQYIGPGGIAPATVTDNPLTAAATTINVTSTANYVVPGVVLIDSEYIHCTSISGGNQFTGCTRVWAGSLPSTHNLGSALTQAVITSTGTVGNAQRAVRATLDQNGGAMLSEPFLNGSVPSDAAAGNDCAVSPALAWCYNYQNNGGTSLYDAAASVNVDGTGSLRAQSNLGRNNRLRGYRQRPLGASIAAGTAVTLQMAYKKNYAAALPSSHVFEVQLVYSTGATVTPAGWGHAAASNANIWTALAPAAFTVPAGRTVTAVRIYFDLRNPNSNGAQTQVWFDEVRLTTPGGATVLSWQELVP
jgi:hypothetical protein